MNTLRSPGARARRLLVAAVVVLAVTGLAACGGSSNKSSSGGGGGNSNVKADATLDVTGFSFKDVSIKAGGTLAIKNSSGAAHTFTPDNSGDFKDTNLPDGQTTTVTAPPKPGEYKFHCTIHPSMTGTMTVT
jgi:plastocyanin